MQTSDNLIIIINNKKKVPHNHTFNDCLDSISIFFIYCINVYFLIDSLWSVFHLPSKSNVFPLLKQQQRPPSYSTNHTNDMKLPAQNLHLLPSLHFAMLIIFKQRTLNNLYFSGFSLNVQYFTKGALSSVYYYYQN